MMLARLFAVAVYPFSSLSMNSTRSEISWTQIDFPPVAEGLTPQKTSQ
jgi:hypothetical protein